MEASLSSFFHGTCQPPLVSRWVASYRGSLPHRTGQSRSIFYIVSVQSCEIESWINGSHVIIKFCQILLANKGMQSWCG